MTILSSGSSVSTAGAVAVSGDHAMSFWSLGIAVACTIWCCAIIVVQTIGCTQLYYENKFPTLAYTDRYLDIGSTPPNLNLPFLRP